MNIRKSLNGWRSLGHLLSIALLGGLLQIRTVAADAEVLYATGFERAEGFDPQFTLRDQGGWLGDGSGGDGLVEAFEGLGQQAYIGLWEPLDANSDTTVWRPVNVVPLDHGYPVLKFSVKMQVVASTTGGNDEFRWSVYATNNYRLLSIAFDNATKEISYITEDDDAQFVFANALFDHDGSYDLEVVMNYSRNFWSATLNGVPLVNSHPITASPEKHLSFSDVSAAWIVANPSSPGNNYMVFDNYSVSAQLAAEPRLEAIQYHSNGDFEFKVLGEEGLWYEVQVTSDWENWFSLGEYQAGVGGVIIIRDTTAPSHARGFYSAALIAPPE